LEGNEAEQEQVRRKAAAEASCRKKKELTL